MEDTHSAVLQDVIDTLEEAFFICTEEGEILTWNQRVNEITGYSDEEISDMSFTDFVPDEDADRVRAHINEVLETGSTRLEVFFQSKHGDQLPIEFSGSLLEREGKRLICGTGRDITDRKYAEEQAETVNELLRHQISQVERQNALVRLLKEVASAANEAEKFEDALQVAINRICEHTDWPVGHVYLRNWGASSAEADPKNPELHPTEIWNQGSQDHFDKFRAVTEETSFVLGEGLPGRVLEQGAPAWIEDVTTDPNFPRAELAADLGVKGAFAFPVPLEEDVIAVLEFFSEKAETPDPELLGVMESIGVQLGRVAEREWAHQQLQASENRYRALTETAVDGIVVADSDGIIIDWNQGAETIFGYEKDEILGRPLETLMPERYEEPHRQGMERVNRTGEGTYLGQTIELEGLRKSGEEFPLGLSLSSWTTGEDRYFAAIIRDITERKQLEREILKAQEEERKRLGQELHDGIASQLTGATLKLNVLSSKARKDALSRSELIENLQEVQSVIQESGNEVRRLSRGLNPGGLSEGDLPAALKGLAQHTEGGRFETRRNGVRSTDRNGSTNQDEEHREALPKEALTLDEGVATHLYRIAQEAVTNARRHGAANEIVIRLGRTESGLYLEVEDNGTGFDPTVSKQEGLGIRSMRHRADLMGANLTIESAPGKGTLVHCQLPS